MRTALHLFAIGLLARAVPWLLSPERAAIATAAYRGDAEQWLAGVGARDTAAQLPFRPPGMEWLAAAFDALGAGPLAIRAVFVALGAALAPVLWLSLRRLLAPGIALAAAALCAMSSALITVGTGLHGEVPYLLLVLAALPDGDRLRCGSAPRAALRWGALSAGACLIRVDHLLFTALVLAWLVHARRGSRRRDLLLAAGTVLLLLLPWQLHAVLRTAAFNGGDPAVSLRPPPQALPWDDAALERLAAAPAFARLWSIAFVDATVRHRGGARVVAADLDLIEAAFGSAPEPLAPPLLALYGPLNFYLANSPEALAADGGFTRAPLDRRPPLLQDRAGYPPWITEVQPGPGQLRFDYPPHLAALNHGYRLGLSWLWSHPGAGLELAWLRLLQTWRGAAAGIGNANLPFGRGGDRAAVDLVVAGGPSAAAWIALLAVAAAVGARRAHRLPGTTVFAWWLLARAIVAAAFFGYARFGALCVPVVAVYLAHLLPASIPIRRARHGAWAVLAAVLVADLWTAGRSPSVAGAGAGAEDARAVVSYPSR